MRSAKNLIITLGSIVLLAAPIQADENSWTAMEVSVKREPINTAVPVFRAFINAGEEKFTLLIPEDFHTGGDPAHGRFQLMNTDGNCVINFSILGPSPEGSSTLDAGAYREMLKQRYPGAKVLNEFKASAGSGESGPGFDIQWKGTSGFIQKTRAVYLSTSAGVVEMFVTTGANKFGMAQATLDRAIGTLSCSSKGKLVYHEMSDRS